MATVRLLRQLDGKSEGETAEYPDLDAKRLEDMGVVVILDATEASLTDDVEQAISTDGTAKATSPENTGQRAALNNKAKPASPAKKKAS